MKSQDLDVAHHKPDTFDHGDHFGKCGNVATGKDVFRDPGIRNIGRVRPADRMQHHDPVVGEQFSAASEIGFVEIDADMLEHADRHDAVERTWDVAIVLKQELGRLRQILLGGAGIRRLQLFCRERDAGDVSAGHFRQIQAKAAPA